VETEGDCRCELIRGGTIGLFDCPRCAAVTADTMGEFVPDAGNCWARGVVMFEVFEMVGEGCCARFGVFGEFALLGREDGLRFVVGGGGCG
jgi:hypothetical protein